MSPMDIIGSTVQKVGEYSNSLVTLATTIGLVSILFYSVKITVQIYQGLKLYVFNGFCCQNEDLKQRYGQWAVISGSTDGIGLALARELARRGMSIIVIGRDEGKLAATKGSLEQEPNVGEILTVKIDLSDSSLENFNNIRDKIDPDHRDIGILINNAGVYPTQIRRFNHYDMDFLRGQVNVNILATLHLTRMIMPSMIDRGKGLLVNVSSILATTLTPYAAVYGPTKTFMDAFSRQLQIEYSRHPIDIINLAPGVVQTNHLGQVLSFSRSTFFNPMPDDYAKSALSAISIARKGFVAGHLFHGFCIKADEYCGGIAGMTNFITRRFGRDLELSPVLKRRNK